MYIRPLPLESPSRLQFIPTPLGSSLSSLSHTANSHWLSVYIWWCRCIHAALSIYLTLSLLSPTLVHKYVLYICMDRVHLMPSSDGLLSDRPPGNTGDGKSSREKRWVPEPFRKWNALDLVTGWLWTVRNRDQVKDVHRFLPPASEWCHACCCFSHSSSFLLPSPSSLLPSASSSLFDIIPVSTMQHHLSAGEIVCHDQSGLEVGGQARRKRAVLKPMPCI